MLQLLKSRTSIISYRKVRISLLSLTVHTVGLLHLYRRKFSGDFYFSFSQRFVDVCEGRVPRGSMTLMKEISLAKTTAAGQYLYYRLQDIVWDDVMSKYILHPKVSSRMTLWNYIRRTVVIIYTYHLILLVYLNAEVYKEVDMYEEEDSVQHYANQRATRQGSWTLILSFNLDTNTQNILLCPLLEGSNSPVPLHCQ